jgi:plasmid maintenance system antidote protein VapI
MAFKKKNKDDVSVNEIPEILDAVIEATEDVVVSEPIVVSVIDTQEVKPVIIDEVLVKVQTEDKPVEKQKTSHKHPLKYVEEAMNARSWNVGNVVSIIQDFSTDAERETILNLNYENCKITPKMAMLFEYVFGISHLTWLKYQSDYENN